MRVTVIRCDGCDRIITDAQKPGSHGGFTEPSIERRPADWPDSLYHLCGYCDFWAKVGFIKKRAEQKSQAKAERARFTNP